MTIFCKNILKKNMKLDFNFKKEYEKIINANQELADWFKRN